VNDHRARHSGGGRSVDHRRLRGRGPRCSSARGWATACRFVAATDNDTTNLSLVAAVRRANPELFIGCTPQRRVHKRLFDAADADFVLAASEVIAHEVLARTTGPLAARFIDAIPGHGESWSADLLARLAERCGARVPMLWRVHLTPREAPALRDGCAPASVR